MANVVKSINELDLRTNYELGYLEGCVRNAVIDLESVLRNPRRANGEVEKIIAKLQQGLDQERRRTAWEYHMASAAAAAK